MWFGMLNRHSRSTREQYTCEHVRQRTSRKLLSLGTRDRYIKNDRSPDRRIQTDMSTTSACIACRPSRARFRTNRRLRSRHFRINYIMPSDYFLDSQSHGDGHPTRPDHESAYVLFMGRRHLSAE